jgi:heme exporter protein D
MSSIAEFFNMGGYALYVWGSFGATALLMVLEPVFLRKRRAGILKRLDRMTRMKAGRSE